MTITATVTAPFQVVDKGVVYGPGASVTADDDTVAHWVQHNWVVITTIGAASTSGVVRNPSHTVHIGSPPSAAPGVNEVQQVAIAGANSGTFTLAFNAAVTTPLAFNIGVADLQTALEALPTIGAGNVAVTGEGNTFAIEFKVRLGRQNVAALVADATNLKPPGTASVTVTTVVQGSATVAAAEAPAKTAAKK